MTKHIHSLSLLLCALIFVVSCGGAKSQLVGKWEETRGDMALEFFDSGTMIMTLDRREFSGTYELPETGQVRMMISGDLGMNEFLLTEVEVTDTTMVFYLDGDRYELTRTQK
jgi:hypothetical protein